MLTKTDHDSAAIEIGLDIIWLPSDGFIVVCDSVLMLTKTNLDSAATEVGYGII